MKNVYIPDTKTCDICSLEDATYDAPTIYGSWANMCADCFIDNSSRGAREMGYRLIVGEKPVMDDDDKVAAIHQAMTDWDMDTLDELVGDGDICEYI